MHTKNYHTIAGVPADQIHTRLAKPFSDPSAYKKVNGTGADLTDIKTGFMLKRINEVFGLKGLGWNLLYDRDDLVLPSEVASNRILVRLKFAEFVYFLIHNESGERVEIRVPTSGANENTPQYAEEGAKTVALGTALKGMGFQEDVYLGYLNHRNAGSYQSGSRSEKGHKPQKADPGNVVISFGKNKGKKLKQVSVKALDWYANVLEPKSDTAMALQHAARAYLAKAKPPQPDNENGNGGNGNGKKVKPSNGNGHGNFVVPFGKHKGKRLSALDAETIQWYAEEMTPINDEGKSLKQAAVALVAA